MAPDFCTEQDPSWPPSHLTPAEFEKRLENAYDGGFNISTSLDPSTSNPTKPESATRILSDTQVVSKIAKASLIPFAPLTDAYASTVPETVFVGTLDGRVRAAIATRWHPLHTSEYLWTKSFLPTFIQRYVGGNVDMLYHVVSRPPFLDHHLTEYVNGLPTSLKIKYQDPSTSPSPSTPNNRNNESASYILRQAARPYVTDENLHRKEKSFIGPARFKQNGPLRCLLSQYITQENVKVLGFGGLGTGRLVAGWSF